MASGSAMDSDEDFLGFDLENSNNEIDYRKELEQAMLQFANHETFNGFEMETSNNEVANGGADTDNMPSFETVTNGNNTQNEMPLELEKAMLHFVLRSSRIFFINQVEMWEKFYNSNTENFTNYGDYTAKELCEHFQHSMLPHIFEYEMTKAQKSVINFMDMNKDFKREGNGYVRVQPSSCLGCSNMAKPNINFHVAKDNDDVDDIYLNNAMEHDTNASAKLDADEVARNIGTIAVPTSYLKQCNAKKFQFSKENAALLSAVFSSEEELATNSMLTPNVIHERMRRDKTIYENTGRLPENLTNENLLIQKIERWKQLEESMINVMSKKFLQD